MKLKIKTHFFDPVIEIDCSPEETVATVKSRIKIMLDIPIVESIELYNRYGSYALFDQDTIKESITDDEYIVEKRSKIYPYRLLITQIQTRLEQIRRNLIPDYDDRVDDIPILIGKLRDMDGLPVHGSPKKEADKFNSNFKNLFGPHVAINIKSRKSRKSRSRRQRKTRKNI